MESDNGGCKRSGKLSAQKKTETLLQWQAKMSHAEIAIIGGI
jgi:hypothetical protein